MEFRDRHSIYLQIADLICENILTKLWKEEDKIPSIRDMAVNIEVNPNTVMRTYTYLQEKGIIQNQRGIGYFVAAGAPARVQNLRKSEFLADELPRLFKTLDVLQIEFREIERLYKEYRHQKEAS